MDTEEGFPYQESVMEDQSNKTVLKLLDIITGKQRPLGTSHRDAAIMIVIATVGMLGNFAIITAICVLPKLRRAANAFLLHQSLLDFMKAGYCLPFAQSMVAPNPPRFCTLLSGSYMVFVTTSSFNMLALVMNEAYQFSDMTLGLKDSRNSCCVCFGIFTIWFGSIIINLGVAVIPGNPSFDWRVGECIFLYGISRKYVLHMLWMIIVTMAIIMTFSYIKKLHGDIRRSSYYRLSTLIRATMMIDAKSRTASQRRQSVFKEKHHIKHVEKVTTKKLILLILFVLLFVMFNYPLFLLTAIDLYFQVNPSIYTAFAMTAWSSPTVTPFVLIFFIKNTCCCRKTPKIPVAALNSEEHEEQRLSPAPSSSHLNDREVHKMAVETTPTPKLQNAVLNIDLTNVVEEVDEYDEGLGIQNDFFPPPPTPIAEDCDFDQIGSEPYDLMMDNVQVQNFSPSNNSSPKIIMTTWRQSSH